MITAFCDISNSIGNCIFFSFLIRQVDSIAGILLGPDVEKAEMFKRVRK